MAFKTIQPDDFPFGKVMESMKGDDLRARIEKAWTWEMPELTPIPYIGEIDQTVQYYYKELTARCPVTGIQDLYKVKIKFIPNKSVPELKSLKMLFLAYRDLPVSHEHLQAKIFKQFEEQVKPKKLSVELDVAVRGGIYTNIQYER